jgi:hypothetical protein
MGNKIQTLAAVAGIFGLLVAVLALMRDAFDYKVPWIPLQSIAAFIFVRTLLA